MILNNLINLAHPKHFKAGAIQLPFHPFLKVDGEAGKNLNTCT